MNNFKNFIKIEGRNYYVHFTKVFYPGDDKFFVLVTGENVVLHFDMEKDNLRHWRLASPAPDWIMTVQTELSGIIERSYKG